MILSGTSHPLPCADVCVVGAGPVGLALACKLADLGLSVLVLEAGPATKESPGSRPDIEFTTNHHAVPEATSNRGIGGNAALWGGRCVPFDDLDFASRAHVPFSGWPIPHSELSRYYDEALTFLQCRKAATPLRVKGDDQPVHLDAIEYWSRQPRLGDIYAEKLASSNRITVVPGALAADLVPSSDGKRIEAVRIRRGSKTDEVPARSIVLAAGGLETARLLLSLQRRGASESVEQHGALGRFYQGHLTGYLAMVEFTSEDLAKDLSFQSDEHGYCARRRMQVSERRQNQEKTLNTVFWIDAMSIADPLHGSGTLSLLYLLLFLPGLYRLLSRRLAPRARPAGRGDLLAHLRNIAANGASLRDMLAFTRLGQSKTGHAFFYPARRYLLRYHAEQAPDPDSRVQLRDTSNGPVLSVHYQIGEQDVKSVLRSHAILEEWLAEKKFGKLRYLHREPDRERAVLTQACDGYHQIGLTRMSAGPEDGVVDVNCRAHGLQNLYLAGAGVFPTGGQANPTLPAVALALRLAEHLACLVETQPTATAGVEY